MSEFEHTYTAFVGVYMIASGELMDVLTRVKLFEGRDCPTNVLIFDDWTGKQIDFNFQGTVAEVIARIAEHPIMAVQEVSNAPSNRPGRPKLGVISREISMLPRHWEWLESQPNGISATLRRLVEEARKRDPEGERQRSARDAILRIMTVLAGDRSGFEEASRTLYAGDYGSFDKIVRNWPEDIYWYIDRMVQHRLMNDTTLPVNE
ncbi:MAG: DUF2239 family protein [bacterium]|nr:DUF2239 family protein [bacterium]